MTTDASRRASLLERWRRVRRRRARRRPDLLAGFWFVAVVVALLGPALAAIILAIDKSGGPGGVLPQLVISPESARTILGSISGSLITIASLTSSLTIVTLQLLSSQYTPRTVRGFLSTRLSQVVLGGFIGIFLYCLILLVTVREEGEANTPFVPTLGVLLSVVLAVAGLVMLVVFIHAMSQTIQVSTMTARIAGDTASAIDRIHEQYPAIDAPVSTAGTVTTAVLAERAGYVRGVDVDALEDELHDDAVDHIEVHCVPGDFVTAATTIAVVRGRAVVSDRTVATLREAVIVEREREIRFDPAYGMRQLVDIALRALSPGINDPSTAVTCMGYLRDQLEKVASRELPACCTVQCGRATLELPQPTFGGYLELLTEIAPYAGTDTRVVNTLLRCFDGIAASSYDEARAAHVRSVREQIRLGALDEARLPRDRDRLAGPPPGVA